MKLSVDYYEQIHSDTGIDIEAEVDIAAQKAIRYGTDFIDGSIQYIADQIGVHGGCEFEAKKISVTDEVCKIEIEKGFLCCRPAFYAEIRARIGNRVEELLSTRGY